jgi:hypothetical protein
VAVLSIGGSVIITISHNVTRFNMAKVEALFFLFIYIYLRQPFPYSLRLLEVFNVTLLAYHFYRSISIWCGPKGLHADIGSLKRFGFNRYRAS